MPKCLVKNPCKVCLKTVNHKTGLQCNGSCHLWLHYACLNYTPGKIKDIKAGIIKINCPCLNCTPTFSNEYRTDLPLSCTDIDCPANQRTCENKACPSKLDTQKIGINLTQRGVQCDSQSDVCTSSGDVPKTRNINVCKPGKNANAGFSQQLMENIYKKLEHLAIDINQLLVTVKQAMCKSASGGSEDGLACARSMKHKKI